MRLFARALQAKPHICVANEPAYAGGKAGTKVMALSLRTILGVVSLATAVTGCASMPQPATIQPDLLAYNEAIAVSAREQLLLNIVRLRYRDTVAFLQITGVTTSYAASRSGALSSALGLDVGPFDENLGLRGESERSVRPLVEYEPLQGPGYAQQLLSPIAPESLFLLSQSGWSAERLLLCCVARVGPMENARAAAGPTPDFVPDNAAFRAFAGDLRALQLEGGLIVEIFNEDNNRRRVVLTVRGSSPIAARVRTHLGMSENTDRLIITDHAAEAGAVNVRGRSLLGILSALSQTVNVPDADQGRLVTATPPGQDWGQVMSGLFAVQVSDQRPTQAAVSVRYRGHWFYIPDTDLQSKSTLDLVNHLFALQAARGQAGAIDPFIVLSPGG
jgi:hypothetical protein